jgi:hypothetical protein
MQHILNGTLAHDLRTSLDADMPDAQVEHKLDESIRFHELRETGPVAHTVDAKVMGDMRQNHGAAYRAYFSGLEVSE